MGLADIGNVADDIRLRAVSLQEMFEDLLSRCQKGSDLYNELVTLKCCISGIKMESLRLTSLTATARMTGDLPKERALAPVEALPLFQGLATRSPQELMALYPHHFEGPDFKTLAAGDDTFADDQPTE